MGYKLELNPEAFARTQQGGCVMTSKDTDTNIIEPFILKDGRASGRTAINRDGLLYDVLPYEPAMSLKDGVMVLSEEPLDEELYGFTEDFSAWNSSGSLTYVANTNNGLLGEQTADSLYEVASTSIHRISKGISVPLGEKRTVSVFIKKNLNRRFLINVDLAMGVKCLIDLETGGVVDTLETAADFSVETEEFDSFFRVYLTGTGTGIGNNVYFQHCEKSHTTVSDDTYLGDVNERMLLWGVNITTNRGSYIQNLGSGTKVRLGATGVKTPDISKYINSEEGVLEVRSSAFQNGGSFRELLIWDGSDPNYRIRLFYNDVENKVSVFIVVAGSTIFATEQTIGDQTALNEFKIKWKESDYGFKVNGTELYAQSSGVSFPVEKLKVIEFNNSSGSNVYNADIKYFNLSGGISNY